MLKNYLKLTLKLLKRKKVFSAITIFGMAIPLMFLMIIVSSISHFTSNKAPQSNFDKTIFLKELKYSIKRPKRISGNMTGAPSYHFVKNYIKPMKTPEKIGFISSSEFYNLYVNNKKTKLTAVYTDEVFWKIADFDFSEGKAFTDSDLENSQLVTIIDEYTKELVFGDENVIGRTMKIFKKNYKIVGVVKNVDRTRQKTYSNIWLPITTSEKYFVNDIYGNGGTCILLAKTKEQIPLIKEEYSHLIKNFDLGRYEGLTEIDGELSSDTFNTKLKSILNDLFSIDIKETYLIYLAYAIIFFFFILLPSINLLYIHSSRTNERSSEIGVRKSFGGAKHILSNQFIIENITISLFSGILGLIFTFLLFGLLNSSQIIPGLYLSLNIKSLVICFLLWLLFGVSTGLFPAIRMSRVKIIDALNQIEMHKNITLLTKKVKRLKIILIIEFALTFLSLAVILTFVFRFQENSSFPLGFDYKDAYQVSVNQYDKQITNWFGRGMGNEEINELIKSHDFVEYYGKCQWNEPYHYGYTTVVDGIKYKEKEEKDNIHFTITDKNIEKVFNLNVINGRWFDETDDRPDYNPLVLNRSCKTRVFGDKNAIGEYVDIRGSKCQVIGIIDHYKYHGEFSTPVDIVFSRGLNNISISSRGKEKTDFFRVKPGTSPEDVNSMAKSVSQKYPDYEINVTSLDSVRTNYIRKTFGPIIIVLIVFSIVMLIVLLGLFGVLWYNISLRKQEIGIRRATGATSTRIFSLIVREMLISASVGIILGLLFFMQIPLLNLFSIKSGNSLTSIFYAALIIYVLVIICSLLPAKQAAKIQPAIALHEE